MLSPPELDFSDTGNSGRTVTLTNHTTHKVIACWMMVNETRYPSAINRPNEVDSGSFLVFPNNVEIPAKTSQEFTVHYRPTSEMKFDGEVLECFVSYKRNRNFRLVDLKKFTPPWALTLRCLGHTMGFHRDDCRVELPKEAVKLRPVAGGQRSYATFQVGNVHSAGSVPASTAISTATPHRWCTLLRAPSHYVAAPG